jgi:GAF domain-containing protein
LVSIDRGHLESSLRTLTTADPDSDLVRTLTTISHACLDLFGVDGCGIMFVDDHNNLRDTVASDPHGRLLEHAEMNTQQGPCTDSYITNTPVAATDLHTDPRWPLLAAHLTDTSIHAVLGVPIRLGGGPVGTLDVLRRQPHEWDESERNSLQRYGDVIEATLAATLTAHAASELAAQLQYALDSRIIIERSIGYLMARDRVDALDAFNRLRHSARSGQRKIGAVAEDLLRTGHLPSEKDTPPGPPSTA